MSDGFRRAGFHLVIGVVMTCVDVPSLAGPPFLTDDPAPTDAGHWEVFAFTAGDGQRGTFDADAGFDINYGLVEGVQLTATLPLSFSRAPLEGWRSGTGDVEAGVKIRLFKDDASGVQVAVFPKVGLPTASHASGEKTRVQLPVWVQKDFAGGTSIFGGGGYTFNPGTGNRNFWHAAVAVTQDLNDKFTLGAEVAREARDAEDGTGATHAGIGGIVQVSENYALLFSGGPTWADRDLGYHFYLAVGANY